MLSYEDVNEAGSWLSRAFGFYETGRWTDNDGIVSHLNMEHNGETLMLGHPSSSYESPKHHAESCRQARTWSETPYVIDGVLVYVKDLDLHFRRAKAAGATILSGVEENEEIGQRQYRAADIEGHRWMFAELTEAQK
jgi:PhnB protein